jgi:molybdopterin synthase sulfur carrier subunit
MTSTDTQFDRRFEDHSGQDLRSGGPAVPAGTQAGPGAQAAPTIAVRLFAGAAAEYGADATTVHARTLQELVDALTAGASERAAQVIARSSFLVDGVARTDRGHELEDGARVDVLPPFAGG